MDRADVVEDLALQPVVGRLATTLGQILLNLSDLSANVGAKLPVGGLRVIRPPDVEPDPVAQLALRRFPARRCT